MVIVGYSACFTASPPVCRRLMPHPTPPSNPTCVATMGLLRHRRPPPTTLPLSSLACYVVEPCNTSTTGSHGDPLILSRRPPKVVGDAGDGWEARWGERRGHATRTGEAKFDCMRKKRSRWGLSRWGIQNRVREMDRSNRSLVSGEYSPNISSCPYYSSIQT
jgi:hypothetical protein